MSVSCENVSGFQNPISEEDRLDFDDMSEFADLMVDYAEEALRHHPISRIKRSLGFSDRAPSRQHDRVLLTDLAEISVRSLNTAMIENPIVLSLLADHDEDVFDGVTRALVIDADDEVTHLDLNKGVDRAVGFIATSRNRKQRKFDRKSAVDLFDIVYGSMEVLKEASKMNNGEGIELYNGAHYDAERAMSAYDKANLEDEQQTDQGSRGSIGKVAKETVQWGVVIGVSALIGKMVANHVVIPLIYDEKQTLEQPQYDPKTPVWDPVTGDPAV